MRAIIVSLIVSGITLLACGAWYYGFQAGSELEAFRAVVIGM